MNNVNLSGRFTADPVIRYSKSNYAFASFTLAVDRYSHRDGEPSTDFIDCYAIGRTAAVSYTHLTLPTNREVQISVVAVAIKKKKKEEQYDTNDEEPLN